MPYQPGEILLDKYRIEALLGQGTFGEVYRVTHLGLKVTRALKILCKDAPGVGSTEFNECKGRFQFEAQLGARLNSPTPHPHLLQAFNYEEKGDLLLLEMEYASGGSLAERLAELKQQGKMMPVDEAVQMGVEVAQGLAALHEQDIVHRDLKPSNILFDRNGNAKVADLGLAQAHSSNSLRSQISNPRPHPGTPAYMSPEQENARTYLSSASDVYALGLVLFEALTGRVYRNQRPGIHVRELRPDVPDWLDELLARMLAVEPQQRPWNGQETASSLRDGKAEQAERQKEEASLQEQQEKNRQETEKRAVLAAQAQLTNEAEPRPAETARLQQASAAGLTPRTSKTGFPRIAFVAGVVFFLVLACGAGYLVWKFLAPGGPATPTANPTQPLAILSSSDTPVTPATNVPVPEVPRIVTLTPSLTLSPTPTYTLTSHPNSMTAQTSLKDGMQLLPVAAGDFLMGNNAGRANETPAHTVWLDAFWIDQTEVSNGMYAMCVQAGACREPQQTSSFTRSDYYGNLQYDNYPVIAVLWEDANAYCAWAGRRLPTEAEWEKAARGTDGRLYPWGNEFDAARANFCDQQCPRSFGIKSMNDGNADTAGVDSYPEGASPYGALNMSGNVWEWVNDWYGADYYSQSPSRNPQGPATGAVHDLRGGSWGDLDYQLRVTWRAEFKVAPELYPFFGFRCAQSGN
jgi:eukaryotic-like serine/threonine-protein kinase